MKATKESEADVRSIMKAINEFESPFHFDVNKKSSLKNIATGSVVKEEFKEDILCAKSLGRESAKQYMEERLYNRTVSFWDPLPKLRLKTFASGEKELKVRHKNETVTTPKGLQNLFSRLITVSTTRKIDLKSVLSYELYAVPLSLFHVTGEMRKTAKSKLLQELEVKEHSLPSLEFSERSATIVDFMAVVQSNLHPKTTTFGQLLESYKLSVIASLRESKIVVLVPDRYDVELLIKSAERSRRQKATSNEVLIRNGEQKLTNDLSFYLGNPKNKTNLINYTFNTWATDFQNGLQDDQFVYFANLDGTATKISHHSLLKLPWTTDHEEADSKMFVFAEYLVNHHGIDQIIIASPDTDVIACYQFATNLSSLSKFWFKTGVGSKRRYVAIHETAEVFGSAVLKILPVFHCITGCDSVSSFSGIGKKSAFAVLKENVNDLLAQLEPEFIVLGGVPENVLELVSCRCQKGSKTNACACRKSKLACSNACSCDVNDSCENTEHFIDDDDDSDVDM